MGKRLPTAVVPVVAVVLLATGAAGAASLITGKDIEDHSIKNRDIAKHTISLDRLRVQAIELLQGQTGPAGPSGAPGPTGPSGPSGPAGEDGVAGVDGTTWLTGIGAPGTTQGVVGDFFLNSANGDVYMKTLAGWKLLLNVKGAIGPQGPVGPTGPSGPAGDGAYLYGADDYTAQTFPAPTHATLNYSVGPYEGVVPVGSANDSAAQVITQAGVYEIRHQLRMDSGRSGRATVEIRINGVTRSSIDAYVNNEHLSDVLLVELQVGDQIEIVTTSPFMYGDLRLVITQIR